MLRLETNAVQLWKAGVLAAISSYSDGHSSVAAELRLTESAVRESMRLQDPSAADFDVALVSSAEITRKIYKVLLVLLSNEHKHKRRHSFRRNKLQEREDKTEILLMNFEPCMLFFE